MIILKVTFDLSCHFIKRIRILWGKSISLVCFSLKSLFHLTYQGVIRLRLEVDVISIWDHKFADGIIATGLSPLRCKAQLFNHGKTFSLDGKTRVGHHTQKDILRMEEISIICNRFLDYVKNIRMFLFQQVSRQLD